MARRGVWLRSHHRANALSPHPEEQAAGLRLEGWGRGGKAGRCTIRASPFETPCHSASKTRVHALMARLLRVRVWGRRGERECDDSERRRGERPWNPNSPACEGWRSIRAI